MYNINISSDDDMVTQHRTLMFDFHLQCFMWQGFGNPGPRGVPGPSGGPGRAGQTGTPLSIIVNI